MTCFRTRCRSSRARDRFQGLSRPTHLRLTPRQTLTRRASAAPGAFGNARPTRSRPRAGKAPSNRTRPFYGEVGSIVGGFAVIASWLVAIKHDHDEDQIPLRTFVA